MSSVWLAIIAILVLAPQPTVASPPQRSAALNPFDQVVIDAGHGGRDEGAVGPAGLKEKDLVLDISNRLARRLRERGLGVVLTRQEDVFVPLEERTSRANDARADLFISIHANAAHSRKPRGVETYFVSLEASDASARQVAERENQALGRGGAASPGTDPLLALLGDLIATEHMEESNAFAKLAQQELSRISALPSRGVRQAPFVVLMGVQMPATLVEIGFLSNREDAHALGRAEHRDSIAEALAHAVMAFGKRYDARRGIASH